MDRKAAFPFEAVGEISKVVAPEKLDSAARFAQQQMLMTVKGWHIGMATVRPMDPLHLA
jgi:hypothetical protein